MKTLTITDAKKNLGHWLNAAARGEDVGIVSGANIIALRKVEVTSVEDDYAYARREYGVTRAELQALEKRLEAESHDKRRKSLVINPKTAKELKEAIEKAAKH